MRPLLASCAALLTVVLLPRPVHAQFPSTPTQTFFVCNAPGEQQAVRAFADGANGSFVYWLDKRGGSAVGTAIYGQHLNAAGAPQWPANGRLAHQARGKNIWALQAVAWRGGTLLAWTQGPFGGGGDSLLCQFYNAAGAPQWTRPTLVAARGARSIIYVTETGFNILPNDSGATITHSLIQTGGAKIFSYNRVGFTGQRRWPLNNFFASLNNTSYFNTISDGGNGFFVVGSTGGLGAGLVAQRYRLQGQAVWPAFVGVSSNATGGRGEGDWPIRVLPDTSLVVTWGRDTPKDIVAVKLTRLGAYAWANPTYRFVCDHSARQDDAQVLRQGNDLVVIWNDNRPPANNTHQYAQKLNLTTGTRTWATDGIPVFELPNYISDPKIAAADNGAVMAFSYVTGGFRAQKVLPTGTAAWPANGVAVNTVQNDRPFYADFVTVSQPDGSVQVFWTSFSNASICGAKVYPSGVLGATDDAEAAAFSVYPNPVITELHLSSPTGKAPTFVRLLDAQGRTVREARATDHLSVADLPAGIYAVRASYAGRVLTRRVVVRSE